MLHKKRMDDDDIETMDFGHILFRQTLYIQVYVKKMRILHKVLINCGIHIFYTSKQSTLINKVL